MAVPKRRTSSWRRDQRRAQNFFAKLKARALAECPNCGEMTMPHRGVGLLWLLQRRAGSKYN
jgi:LSU ribosomal protein L32P